MQSSKRDQASGGKGVEAGAIEDTRLGSTLLFMQRLWALTNALQASSKRMETELGVTGPQRLALRLLGRMPGVSPSVLADALRVHPSTLTGVLKRLEDAGMLARSADPDDARKSRLALTTKGKAMDRERVGKVETVVQSAMVCANGAALQAVECMSGVLVEDQSAGRSDTPSARSHRWPKQLRFH